MKLLQGAGARDILVIGTITASGAGAISAGGAGIAGVVTRGGGQLTKRIDCASQPKRSTPQK